MQTPYRLNDFLLVIVVITSMTCAIIFPDFGSLFKALPVYCVMVNFFLSYLSIDFPSVWKSLQGHFRQIISFTIMKLFILPVLLFVIFHYLAPTYALSALLLAGISTGVTAPFISNLVRGNSSLVLVVVVITSALAPLTLPAVIELAISKSVAISFFPMIRMLAVVIFVPIIAVEIFRLLTPKLIVPLQKIQFPLSLVMFTLINLGVFYRYAPFFRNEPQAIILALVVAFILAAIYCAVGLLFFRKSTLDNRLAGAVMLGNMNNVLVIVFSSEFFGPVEPMVAAMYMIPFFVLIIPLRYYYHRRTQIQ